MTGKTILLNNRADCEGRFPDRLLSPLLILKKIFLIYISESRLSSDVKNFLNRRGNFSEAENPLSKRIYLSGEDPRFYKRGIGQYPARLSGGFQSPTEINASATQCSTGALLRMHRHARMRRDSVWKKSAYADPNPAPILASEN